jgi:hypothetical protein
MKNLRSIIIGLLLALLAAFALTTFVQAAGTRSALYPTNWSPGFKHQNTFFVQDYSYAGYKGGLELPPPTDDKGLRVQDVPAGADQATIQQKIDAAAANGGGIVRFPADTFTITVDKTHRLRISSSNIVLRGAGPGQTKLRITDHAAGHGWAGIRFEGSPVIQSTDYTLVDADGAMFATSVLVASVSGLAVGDDIAIGWKISNGFRADHNVPWNRWRNGVLWAKDLKLSDAKWVPFFRRQITNIVQEGTRHRVHFDVPLRYDVKRRYAASIRKVTGLITECGIESLSISNTAPGADDTASWNNAWASNGHSALTFKGVKDCWVRNVESYQTRTFKSQPYHLRSHGITLLEAKRMTIRGTILQRSQHRGPGGNGYLYHFQGANEVLVRDSQGRYGRHNFTMNWAFGHSGNVFLDVVSQNGNSFGTKTAAASWGGGVDPREMPDFHHGLAMANLIDRSRLDDGWLARNRGSWSEHAYITATQNVFWNNHGTVPSPKSRLESKQFGQGYVIGAQGFDLKVNPNDGRTCGDDGVSCGLGTEPQDYVEHTGVTDLTPSTLYCDQRTRRGLSCPP